MLERDEVAALRAQIAELEAELSRTRESSEVLDGVLSAVPAIVIRLGTDYLIRDISRVVPGLRREDVIGAEFFAFTPEPDRERLRTIYERVLASGTAEHYQTMGVGPDGRTAAYDGYVARTNEPGGAAGLIVVAIDVTERLERERAFAASEETRILAVEATGVGLWSFDVTSGVVTWNDAMHRICGVDAPLDLEAFLTRLVHPDDRAVVASELAPILAASDRFQTVPHRILRPDGEIRWIVTSGRLLRGEGSTIVRIIGSSLDVTAQRLTEERLRQTQRLEAVGQLAAGVAHNFNNILASIVPVLEIVRGEVPARYRSLVEGAGHSARRAAELVQQLMTFAGQRTSVSRRAEPLGRIVESATSLCRRVLDPRIELTVDDRSEGARVRCDPGAIEQAIVNLVLNARDAIEEAGRGRGHVRLEVFLDPGAGEAGVSVTDDGIGMNAAVVARIFEPFFTTKDVGRGTGLGLAISYATLRDHGGSISCASEPGRGSRFEVRLPIERAPRH